MTDKYVLELESTPQRIIQLLLKLDPDFAPKWRDLASRVTIFHSPPHSEVPELDFFRSEVLKHILDMLNEKDPANGSLLEKYFSVFEDFLVKGNELEVIFALGILSWIKRNNRRKKAIEYMPKKLKKNCRPLLEESAQKYGHPLH